MAHGVLANLLARFAQLLPVRHFGDNFGALGLDDLGRVADVLAQLRIAHQGFCRNFKLRRRRWIQSCSAHDWPPSSLARISAMCTGFTPVLWRCSAPPMC